jgi:hypothetical protein
MDHLPLTADAALPARIAARCAELRAQRAEAIGEYERIEGLLRELGRQIAAMEGGIQELDALTQGGLDASRPDRQAPQRGTGYDQPGGLDDGEPVRAQRPGEGVPE